MKFSLERKKATQFILATSSHTSKYCKCISDYKLSHPYQNAVGGLVVITDIDNVNVATIIRQLTSHVVNIRNSLEIAFLLQMLQYYVTCVIN